MKDDLPTTTTNRVGGGVFAGPGTPRRRKTVRKDATPDEDVK